ncbi:unnamed protein product [Mytilus coruscus]|uniref:CHRNN n=1 Tax=Mytilus coruscus TaxID=42192 RepID=A0A6J8BRX5_MYTCO|nr:unnamed protein product [Mytilus coruscus]
MQRIIPGFLLSNIIGFVCCQSFEDIRVLHEDLSLNYNKDIRPENNMENPTKVHVGINLVTLADLDEVKGQLSIVGFLNISWTDNNLIWDPEDYGEAYSTWLSSSTIWKPRLITGNSVNFPTFIGVADLQTLVEYDGTCYWLPGVLWNLSCKINNVKFPFDIQECSILLFAWPYLHSMNDIKLVSMFPSAKKDYYAEHVTWELMETETYVISRFEIPAVQFDIKFKRRHKYFVITLICPLVFIGILNILVFKIPSQSGERIGYAITVLLSVAVYMTIASNLLPPSSLPDLSYISMLLLENLVLSCFIMFSAIYGLHCYHYPDDKPIPWIYQKLYAWGQKVFRKEKISDSTPSLDSNKTLEYSWNKVTWTQVSENLDTFFFILYFFSLVAIHTNYIIKVI